MDADTLIIDINQLTTGINENKFIESARKSIKDGIDDFDISEDEKAKLIANYEVQLSVGIIGQILQIAKDIPETDARAKLISEQINTEKKRQADIDSAIGLRTEQVQTEKKKQADITSAIELRTEQKKLITEQIETEKKKVKDIEGAVRVKNMQQVFIWQQAKREESKRHIEIKANADNNKIRKADHSSSLMQAYMTRDDYTVTTEQHQTAKDALLGINTSDVNYSTEITNQPIMVTF